VEQKHAVTSAGEVSPKPSTALTSKLRQTYTLDDNVQYAIDTVEKSKSLGQMSKGKTAGDDDLFYIVRFRAKNNGNEDRTVVTDKFSVQTADGQSYGTSDDGKTAVLINGGTKDLFESQLKPCMAKPFLAIFDIPIRFVDSGADLIVPSSKAGSTDRWVIRLDNSKSLIR
jgi:hypothetical protein